jgi:hypothetical protein
LVCNVTTAGVFIATAAVLAWTAVLMVPTVAWRAVKAGVLVPTAAAAVLAYTAAVLVPTVA